VLVFRYQGPKGAPGMPEVKDTCFLSLSLSVPVWASWALSLPRYVDARYAVEVLFHRLAPHDR